MKMCEQILRKKTAPQYNSNSLNCKKNHDVPNNSRYRFAAINKTILLSFTSKSSNQAKQKTKIEKHSAIGKFERITHTKIAKNCATLWKSE